MRNHFVKAIVAAAVVASSAITSSAFAGGSRTPVDVARCQLLRLHGRLTHEALVSSDVDEARQAAARSFADLYQVRENILGELRKQDAYTDLRLALWHQQQQLAGMHLEIPVRIAKIMASATDSLTLRVQINQMETAALDANEAYVAARDDLNAKVAAYQRAVADALARVREDPQFAAMSQQVQAMQRVAAGRGPAASHGAYGQ